MVSQSFILQCLFICLGHIPGNKQDSGIVVSQQHRDREFTAVCRLMTGEREENKYVSLSQPTEQKCRPQPKLEGKTKQISKCSLSTAYTDVLWILQRCQVSFLSRSSKHQATRKGLRWKSKFYFCFIPYALFICFTAFLLLHVFLCVSQQITHVLQNSQISLSVWFILQSKMKRKH